VRRPYVSLILELHNIAVHEGEGHGPPYLKDVKKALLRIAEKAPGSLPKYYMEGTPWEAKVVRADYLVRSPLELARLIEAILEELKDMEFEIYIAKIDEKGELVGNSLSWPCLWHIPEEAEEEEAPPWDKP